MFIGYPPPLHGPWLSFHSERHAVKLLSLYGDSASFLASRSTLRENAEGLNIAHLPAERMLEGIPPHRDPQSDCA